LAHGDADAAAAALRECVEEGIFRRLTDTVAAEVDALVRLCKTKVVLVADGADEQGFKIAVVTRHAYVTVTRACVPRVRVPACDAACVSSFPCRSRAAKLEKALLQIADGGAAVTMQTAELLLACVLVHTTDFTHTMLSEVAGVLQRTPTPVTGGVVDAAFAFVPDGEAEYEAISMPFVNAVVSDDTDTLVFLLARVAAAARQCGDDGVRASPRALLCCNVLCCDVLWRAVTLTCCGVDCLH
jgi:hypothetical protein